MQKSDRHSAILKVLQAKPVSRQEELVHALTDMGFSVTQASVSRDLDELGVVKVNGSYTQPAPRQDLFGETFISWKPAGPNLIVIRTAAGLASASAVRIDAAGIQEIIGTIAGDDTIFVAIADERSQKAVIRCLTELFR